MGADEAWPQYRFPAYRLHILTILERFHYRFHIADLEIPSSIPLLYRVGSIDAFLLLYDLRYAGIHLYSYLVVSPPSRFLSNRFRLPIFSVSRMLLWRANILVLAQRPFDCTPFIQPISILSNRFRNWSTDYEIDYDVEMGRFLLATNFIFTARSIADVPIFSRLCGFSGASRLSRRLTPFEKTILYDAYPFLIRTPITTTHNKLDSVPFKSIDFSSISPRVLRVSILTMLRHVGYIAIEIVTTPSSDLADFDDRFESGESISASLHEKDPRIDTMTGDALLSKMAATLTLILSMGPFSTI